MLLIAELGQNWLLGFLSSKKTPNKQTLNKKMAQSTPKWCAGGQTWKWGPAFHLCTLCSPRAEASFMAGWDTVYLKAGNQATVGWLLPGLCVSQLWGFAVEPALGAPILRHPAQLQSSLWGCSLSQDGGSGSPWWLAGMPKHGGSAVHRDGGAGSTCLSLAVWGTGFLSAGAAC